MRAFSSSLHSLSTGLLQCSTHHLFIHLFCKKQLTERNCTIKLENWLKYYDSSNIQLQIKLQVQILAGVADVQLKRLQSVQNTAARLLSRVRRCDHITPVLRSLHWLPVYERAASHFKDRRLCVEMRERCCSDV